MTYELTLGFGEPWGSYLGYGFIFGYVEVTEEGAIQVYYPRLFHCPRCGTNAPLGSRPIRFYAVESIFYQDVLEVKCDTCWDHPTVATIHKKRKS